MYYLVDDMLDYIILFSKPATLPSKLEKVRFNQELAKKILEIQDNYGGLIYFDSDILDAYNIEVQELLKQYGVEAEGATVIEIPDSRFTIIYEDDDEVLYEEFDFNWYVKGKFVECGIKKIFTGDE